MADDDRRIFKRAAEVLIDPIDEYFTLEKSLEEIHGVYSEITGITAFTDDRFKETRLTYGKAVSPTVAANCLFDLLRTKRFVQGIYSAVVHLKRKFGGEALRILYAGSGPYAALVTPLCFLFEEDVFSCTALDIHKESTEALEKVVAALSLEKYFGDIKTCDAFSYRAPAREKPHLIVSEVLQMGLRNEPQVALTHHLVPALRDGGVFVPKEIRLDLFHSKKTPDGRSPIVTDDGVTHMPRRDKVFLGNILTLNAKTVNEQLAANAYPHLRFKPLRVAVPERRHPDDTLEIQTTLEISDGIFLTEGQSSLTVPVTQTDLRGFSDNTIFEFEYKLSDKPGTEFRVL